MRYSDVKTKHIYNVIFDTVRECEFDKKHLAIVLKKNNDMKTCIVMPLTTERNGFGVNKIKIGALDCLPTSLREEETYAVFNQMRTVNVSRFISLKEASTVINCKIEDDLFFNLLSLGIGDLTFELSFDEKIEFFKNEYEQAYITKAIDSAYNILKLRKEIEFIKDTESNIYIENCTKLESLRSEISGILSKGFEYRLTEKQISDGIQSIFNDILN